MGLDLIAARGKRNGWDEAGTATRTFPITAGDVHIATLGPELPLTVLEPLRQIDEEIALLFSKVLSARRLSQAEVADMVMDFLIAYPDLPSKAVKIIGDIGVNLFGQDGWDALMGLHPSLQDGLTLLSGITEWYGVDLGESSGSDDSSTDPAGGTTSTPTSDDTSVDSISETPSDPPVTTG